MPARPSSLETTYLAAVVILGLTCSGWGIPVAKENTSSGDGTNELTLTIQRDILNDRPIIGIVSQELSKGMKRVYGHLNHTSYIAASYVKFIEAAGGRVVPILINQDDEYYEMLGRSLNGFLIPGGGASLTTSGYSSASKKIYDIVKRNHTEGQRLPLWATCLGFEIVLQFEAGKRPLTRCNASNVADPLFFQPGFNSSRLFGNMSEDLLEALATQNITANFHKWCVLPETFYELGLDDSVELLSTSLDKSGVEYVSTVEHKDYPIFATQWHPEKAAFEWVYRSTNDAIPHSLEAIRVSQALAETFMKEARRNTNQFPSEKEERNYLIYNHIPHYVAIEYKSSFQQCYLF